ncbi:TonB-dependent receptor [Sphingobacterium sp. UT-1RO-CII-1]|uniref:SusC/RagA family TonB-linked outer membrane protein n=1 Tax=Sphingobacterium sp. UT-1RO-CII-1 TaxID=2995225 RepID=UPI00227AE7DB|nr:TonB-dependent receptor [Sphingobacterium sp. UT-1RO-CII-1]MCY4780191.1 TonB-dependent receptor [Sphingobacterium sp. UT-1RO-CII-1]
MKKIGYILMFLIYVPLFLLAQDQKSFQIQGFVYDANKEPLSGVTIYLRDKISIGTSSNDQGKFELRVSRGDMVVFKAIGYKQIEYLVTDAKNDLEIFFFEEEEKIDEVIVVGLGTQRKISNVGAVTSVDVKELQTPAVSIANLLGGRAAGVISLQASGEPGKNISEFWIRGIGTFGANSSALVLVDGLEGDLNSLDPADIESFSILKDASATAVYGVRGANGVVLVTTKKGQVGKLSITGRSNYTLSKMTRLPKYLRALDYAKMANEARVVRDETPIYSDVELDIIEDGTDPDMYPDVSWQDEILKPVSLRQSYYASARGGAQLARYFLSLGGSAEDAAYKYDKKSVYSGNTGYKTYNYRANIDLELAPTSTLYFGTDGFLSVHNTPGIANTDIIWYSQSNLNPLLLPLKYSNGQLPASSTTNSLRSPLVMINNMGRKTSQAYKGKFTLALDQKLPFILDGLRLRLQGAYDLTSEFNESRLVAPSLFQAVGRDQQGKLITIERVPAQAVSYAKGTNQFRKYHLESTLNYDKRIGENHRTSGLIYYYLSDEKWAHKGNSNLTAVPVRYQGVSSRITYGFKDTYMLDVNFGYTGSENFQPGKQYGFFPSIAGGWVPSNYEFVEKNLPWISFLKFRGSYGAVGNDRITNDRRFPYLTLVNQYWVNPWGISNSLEAVNEQVMGADNLEWEKALKTNLGMELNMLEDRFQLIVDFFNDQRNGIFMQRVQVPDYAGLVNMPYGNVGRMKSSGADGNASYRHTVNEKWGFTVRGNFTYSKNNVQNWEEANPKYPYQDVSGYPYGIRRGYRSLGLFKDWDDVNNSPAQFGKVMPGDIKYRDVNGDGVINSDDKVPLSYGTYPLVMFGFGGEVTYKKFTLGFLFKGTGKTDFFYVGDGMGTGYVPFYSGVNGNVLTIANEPSNRWIPKEYAAEIGVNPSKAENPNAKFPRLTYGYNENNSQLSDFWQGDARYLRLQEVNLNYNLRAPFLQRMKVASIDLQFVANNLFLFDKVKLTDPELAHKNGEVYPIPRTFIFQLYLHL